MTRPPFDPHAVSRSLLETAAVDHAEVLALVRRAIAEDLAYGCDITTQATIPAHAAGTAHVVARAPGTIAALGVAAAVLETSWADSADPAATPAPVIKPLIRDGDRVAPGDAILQLTGPLRLLLTAERTLLNLLSQLSGVATETARWVHALAAPPGTPGGPAVAVRDTRKTVPGLRALQKYAVRCGGGVNHRMGLGDAALIKDNHVIATGSITAAFHAVRACAPAIAIEVECDTLAQVTEALDAGADLLLLDNMSTTALHAAVQLARPYRVALEASGGLTLDRAREVASTGVDYIAVGALTHSAPVLDLAMDLEQTR
jgi:nicotinate-nucleotide pyrophosphorylase (carboxylating)